MVSFICRIFRYNTYKVLTSDNITLVGNEVTCNTVEPAWIEAIANDKGLVSKKVEFDVKNDNAPAEGVE